MSSIPMEQQHKSTAKPGVLVDGGPYGEMLIVADTIGESSTGRMYRAIGVNQYTGISNIKHHLVAVKYVHMEKQPEIFNRLRLEVAKSGRVFPHPNILRFRNVFYYKGYYVVVFPYMELGPLRRVMAVDRRLRRGIPETYTLYILYQTLQGLSEIHEFGLVHGQISAEHILLNSNGYVALAFAASLCELPMDKYEYGYRLSYSSFMPLALSCYWAAAPEVYGLGDKAWPDRCTKADIWLIGITALELAYGGLRYATREELETMLIEINTKKRLRSKCPEHGCLKKKFPFVPSCLNPDRPDQHNNKRERVFSKGFVDVVVKCLDFDPTKRPTADELLRHKAFDKVRYWRNLPMQSSTDTICLKDV